MKMLSSSYRVCEGSKTKKSSIESAKPAKLLMHGGDWLSNLLSQTEMLNLLIESHRKPTKTQSSDVVLDAVLVFLMAAAASGTLHPRLIC